MEDQQERISEYLEEMNVGRLTPDQFEALAYLDMSPKQQLEYLRLKYSGDDAFEDTEPMEPVDADLAGLEA